MEALRNVFDDKEEFGKLRGFILEGIQKFSEYRKGNLTYGEIMYVMECVLENLRSTSETEGKKNVKSFGKAVTFTSLLQVTGRAVERLVKKGLLSSSDEAYILHGEE
ncbi:MAG: hypothetical protein A2487_14875 [Candidatus Raymondbacteria bacterium RifOxyC12_full_50_8]|uniref:Uncharacterized protein n=1 Tax=Candidatus Raymondbacteria bacterium RIFOXYD12_FULL_49_13 TaxID=1817890 RepID=A0A1F7FM13_UNCRA|nr:MAG: hypothetical protein A2248_15825 [Candidatus Raymondbacteria bacterium RIFOXYA2_FULL_49_16]OGJ96086.1 MAG: hypothetical protein A2453_08365 [Candidatus Raymondbacteria bacterium RIFOXYC2_FULL_50_21]OGK01440.1 MAG: hypothetical protein A2487_14875 [Candidatus Raymondbacteria bacterium RifOxyC12_full_50_8]OGK01857.1 MAG: hypothetical protein A2350_00835 [Candidatus Raymondbacteria bacterium RifOxyB12_full_50_8]OGK07621.1 MAG: hypothetical protein A2519_21900 [Candidatus Raymondbacteria ba